MKKKKKTCPASFRETFQWLKFPLNGLRAQSRVSPVVGLLPLASGPVRTKIVIDNKIIEQVNLFNYLGNMISYEGELDTDNKLKNFLKITGILNNVFRPQKPHKETRIKQYNTLALPVLLYGSETWTIKASDARRITAAEMKCTRRTAGYTWTDYKTSAQIAKELKITPILDKLHEYKRSWIQHLNRMPRKRLPRVMKNYSPTGRRNHGRPLKRLPGT